MKIEELERKYSELHETITDDSRFKQMIKDEMRQFIRKEDTKIIKELDETNDKLLEEIVELKRHQKR